MINAENLMTLSGCGAFLMTLYWVRVRELRERYAVGWLAVAVLLLLAGLFPKAIMKVADEAHLFWFLSTLRAHPDVVEIEVFPCLKLYK